MSSCFCWESRGEPGYSHVTTEGGDKEYVCRWKCCCLSTCGCILFFAALLSIIIFAGVVPHMAQQSADHSRMILKSVHIHSPTSNSIQMDSVIDLVNAGANGGTIDSMTVTIKSINGTIGKMDLPQITVEANSGGTLSANSTLRVSNVKFFKQSVSLLLSGTDVDWTMTGSTKIHAKLPGGMKQTVSIQMNKKMTLPGGAISHSESSDFTVQQVTTNSLIGSSTISFQKSGMLTMDLWNVSFHLLDARDESILIGFANISHMHVVPGYNSLNSSTSGAKTTIVSLPNGKNDATLSRFFSRFLAGNDTDVVMIGPYNNDGSPSVIEGCLRQVVTNKGSTKPHSAIAGFETRTSMNGWKNASDPSKYIRGGFSNMRNDLMVALRVTKLSVRLYVHRELGFTVDMGAGLDPTVCGKSNHLSHLYSGHGMDPKDFKKTWLDLPAKSKKSFFVIGGPIDQKGPGDFCNAVLGYDCCFAGVVAAHACYNNPNVRNNGDGIFDQDFIAARLYSNMTVLVGGKFEVNLTYYQDFFPVFASMEIYTGFALTAGGVPLAAPNCSKFSNFTV